MLILGVDTAAKTASTAVCDFYGGKVLCEMRSDGNGKISHSENLMPMVDYTLKCAGISLSDIDLFAVSHGPGSFTGIRIGIATTKGLAFGTDKNNCAGVSSLCSLAYNFYGSFDDILIIPVIDARRKQVYNAVFDGRELTYIKSDRIITTGELALELNREFSGRKLAFTGDGADMCYSEIDFHGKTKIPDILKYPSAASLCRAAYEQYKKSGAIHPRALAPSYLIKTQAEREKTK